MLKIILIGIAALLGIFGVVIFLFFSAVDWVVKESDMDIYDP